VKSLERGKRVNSVAGLLVLAVLAGCQTPTALTRAPEDQVNQITNRLSPGKTAGDAAKETNAGTLSGVDIVEQAPPMRVNAAKGGQYVFGDGLLVANIPPGALSEDADVRFIPLDTSKETNTAQRLAGMKFQMDIGKAYIKPGAKITVSSRADKRFVDELKSMYTDFTPDRYSLSQDAQGNWNITMSIDGPRLEPMPLELAPKTTDTRRGEMTEGFAPIKTENPAKFRRDSRIEAYCDYRSQALPAEPPKYRIEAECRWQSDHDSSADYFADTPLDEQLAVGELNDFDGSKIPESAGSKFSISHPHVTFGRVMAAAINPGFHWVTKKWPSDAVAQERYDATITNRSGSTISYTHKLVENPTLDQNGNPECAPGFNLSGNKCEKTVTGSLNENNFADWSLEKQGGVYKRIKMPGEGWVGIHSTQTSIQQNGAQDYTLYEFKTANFKKVGMPQSEVDFNTVINGNSVKVITKQGSPFSPGIFEEVADNLDYNGQGDPSNYSMRKGYTPGGCFCNFVVRWDKIVEDPAPQPVRSRQNDNPGQARNFVQADYTIEMQARYVYPNPRNDASVGLGNIKQVTSSSSNPLTKLRLRKMSPNLTFNVKSPNLPIPASSTIQLELQVEGESAMRVYKFKGNNQSTISLKFPLHVKTDDPLKLEFKRAIVRDLDGNDNPTSKDLNLYNTQASADNITKKYAGLQRNGLYEFDLDLEAQSSK